MPSISFSSIVKSRSIIRSYDKPVQSKEGKVSCLRQQRNPLMGFEPT